jgi:hypothetical protein
MIDLHLEINTVRMAMGQWTETLSSLEKVLDATPKQCREIFMTFSKCLFETQQYDGIVDRGRAVGVGPSPVKLSFNPCIFFQVSLKIFIENK